MKIEFFNPHAHIIYLTGPNGEREQFQKLQRKILPEWYKRYVPRYLRISNLVGDNGKPIERAQPKLSTKNVQWQAGDRRAAKQKEEEELKKIQMVLRPFSIKQNNLRVRTNHIVGKLGEVGREATKHYRSTFNSQSVSISNDIGVGILSYNRLHSLRRLVESIRKYTDLTKTTIFISDESDDQLVKQYLGTITDMVVVGDTRLGVAGNSNRLLRCLSRFNYKILLNDDVEILNNGWEYFYFDIMKKIGYHHFCMRQPGIYSAGNNDGVVNERQGVHIRTIAEKPQGAIITFDHKAFKTVGFFDEAFGLYGMEHVDWSNRISLSGIQPSGYHDVVGSENYFRTYNEKSSTEGRADLLSEARKIFDRARSDKGRIFVQASDKTVVKSISYIIPFRGLDRHDAIKTVLLNIKAQRYPDIEIIIVEQDWSKVIAFQELDSVVYAFAQSQSNDQAFCKSMAFNLGVKNSTKSRLILHDADMLVFDNYTNLIDNYLNSYFGVHIGKNVLYLTPDSTKKVSTEHKLSPDMSMEKSVSYYEGGSLACHRVTYVDIGGYNEEFVGYGCEDCEFYHRLSSMPNFFGERSIDLIHLYHDRADPHWMEHHRRNKSIDQRLRSIPMDVRKAELKKVLHDKYGL